MHANIHCCADNQVASVIEAGTAGQPFYIALPFAFAAVICYAERQDLCTHPENARQYLEAVLAAPLAGQWSAPPSQPGTCQLWLKELLEIDFATAQQAASFLRDLAEWAIGFEPRQPSQSLPSTFLLSYWPAASLQVGSVLMEPLGAGTLYEFDTSGMF